MYLGKKGVKINNTQSRYIDCHFENTNGNLLYIKVWCINPTSVNEKSPVDVHRPCIMADCANYNNQSFLYLCLFIATPFFHLPSRTLPLFTHTILY